jgi:hypothetical protein
LIGDATSSYSPWATHPPPKKNSRRLLSFRPCTTCGNDEPIFESISISHQLSHLIARAHYIHHIFWFMFPFFFSCARTNWCWLIIPRLIGVVGGIRKLVGRGHSDGVCWVPARDIGATRAHWRRRRDPDRRGRGQASPRISPRPYFFRIWSSSRKYINDLHADSVTPEDTFRGITLYGNREKTLILLLRSCNFLNTTIMALIRWQITLSYKWSIAHRTWWVAIIIKAKF